LRLIIGHVSSEAAVVPPFTVIEDKDKILVDISNRKIELLIDSKELDNWLKKWEAPKPKSNRGMLGTIRLLLSRLAREH